MISWQPFRRTRIWWPRPRRCSTTEALEAAIELGNPPQLWKTHVAIGDLRSAQGRTEDARRAYGEALSVIEAVAAGLTDGRLRETFLGSEPVERIQRAAARPS